MLSPSNKLLFDKFVGLLEEGINYSIIAVGMNIMPLQCVSALYNF
jgi:hypothetical protein